jgi:RIO kinase 1
MMEEEDDRAAMSDRSIFEGDREVEPGLRERIHKGEREKRYRRRDSGERKTVEEVFDDATRRALNGLVMRGELFHLNGVVRSGKEARVYWGVAPDGTARAVKIYLTATAEFRKRMRYIAGDMRFNAIPGSVREMIRLWVGKEYKNLELARGAGIRVPRPYALNENILVMEFVGEPPSAAPTFAEAEVDASDYKWTFKMIKDLYRKAGLIHADLSEYNIFKWGEERVLFDMGSAVLSSHPEAKGLLLRDITNMVRFFKKRGVYQKEPLEIMGKIAP